MHDPLLLWRVPPPTRNARHDDRRSTKAADCRFLDVSVTGALILARVVSDLRVGAPVLLDYQGEETSIRIRRIEPYNKSLSVYGVLFGELGPGLKEIIYMAGDRESQ